MNKKKFGFTVSHLTLVLICPCFTFTTLMFGQASEVSISLKTEGIKADSSVNTKYVSSVASPYRPKSAYRIDPNEGKKETESQQLSLSVEEAINYALIHNKSLMQNKNDILKAVYSKREAIGAYITQASAAMDYNNYLGASATMDMGAPITIDFTPSSTLNLQATQLVFNGNAMVGIMLGKIGQQMAELNEENQALVLKKTIGIAYYTALVSAQMNEILRQNYSDIKDMAAKTEIMAKAGAMEQTDADQLQVQVNLVANLLKNNERNTELAYNMLKLGLGMDIRDTLLLTDKLESIISISNDVDLLGSSYDIGNDPDYKMILKKEEMAKKQKLMAIMNFLPSISGFYRYSYKAIVPKFDMSPAHVVGLSLSVPLFSGLQNTNKHRQSRIDLYNAEIQRSLVKDQLSTQEKQLRFNLSTALEQYNTQKMNIEVATRVFKSIQLKYEQGVKSSMELTNANSDYLQAQSDYINAELKLLQARSELEKILGTL
ncbi:MAG: TolC family protein [Bacteroidales bacterium]